MSLRASRVQLKIELTVAPLRFEKRLRAKRNSPEPLKGGRPSDHKLAISDYCGFVIVLTAPTHVRLDLTQEGANEALQIKSTSGARTLLRFRPAVLPEMVDGVVLE